MTNRNKLGDNGLYVLGFDLGASKFQHSVLVVQTMIEQGIATHYINFAETDFFQNFEIYIGKDINYASNTKCAGGPF